MTWSIVARDDSGALGVAIASRFFAVGALCPFVRGGVGALSTQALVNPLYGPRGIEALTRHEAPDAVIRTLTARDSGRDHRQVHIVDAAGRVAAHTGAACIEWCGHLAGHGWSVACSEMTFSYDYEAGRWASLPLGAKVAKLVKLGKVPVQLSLQYEHDFADYQGAPEDTLRFSMKFLFPTH